MRTAATVELYCEVVAPGRRVDAVQLEDQRGLPSVVEDIVEPLNQSAVLQRHQRVGCGRAVADVGLVNAVDEVSRPGPCVGHPDRIPPCLCLLRWRVERQLPLELQT